MYKVYNGILEKKVVTLFSFLIVIKENSFKSTVGFIG